jgi:hypothetical protein
MDTEDTFLYKHTQITTSRAVRGASPRLARRCRCNPALFALEACTADARLRFSCGPLRLHVDGALAPLRVALLSRALAGDRDHRGAARDLHRCGPRGIRAPPDAIVALHTASVAPCEKPRNEAVRR